ncbi:MAG: GTPase HflX [Flavobacteriales bacterium]|jgi:GTP-binding protein HflX|nr:GTPase HflX [Flavobacteriales bacterium]NCG29442.1 GTPase HflX [Bacteroidota bacterium]MBT3963985.1 GTPase HflX [Flavobacteriales bacterium]MBT4703908.1 GTPase HflX [Flavobacteriales bacterium]MBT4931037.1 GTPase HflX [Flavobacteriales bacterium]
MEPHSSKGQTEKAILVGLSHREQSSEKLEEYLDELDFLSRTLGLKPVHRFTQNLDMPHIATFVGSGKLEEIKTYVKDNKIDVVIFDDDLSPSQMRNIEKTLDRKIYDRSLLILDIFQSRAQTAQAKTQVELARNEYLLPRLTRMWTHLERQRGGTSTRGGAGEKEIETDRRMIRNQISVLKKKLEKIDKQASTQRANRGSLIRVSLVGYTNVGKSTIMNLLSKSKVFAENKLFATLDTTVRKVVIKNLPFLLADTVGFIRKLPHQLVESFKSTLDEVRESDVLLHVVDISHPQWEDHLQTVEKTLAEIHAADKPVIVVFNKIDSYPEPPNEEWKWEGEINPATRLSDLKKSWMSKQDHDVIFISAKDRTNLEEFRELLYRRVREIHMKRYPYNSFLYEIPEDDVS